MSPTVSFAPVLSNARPSNSNFRSKRCSSPIPKNSAPVFCVAKPIKSCMKSDGSPSPIRRDSGPIKKRKIVVKEKKPRVRFNEEVEAQRPRAFKTPLLPGATWLKEKDLSKIRHSLFSTLDAMKRKRDAGLEWKDSNEGGKHHSRGLEDYSIDRKGDLKASTRHRRQNAIRAVLHEQDVQYQEYYRSIRDMSASAQQKWKRPPRHVPILDHSRLSRVYREQTGANIFDSIHTGRLDSENALEVYSERPTRPKPAALRRSQSLPHVMQRKKPIAKISQSKWGFAATRTPPRRSSQPPLIPTMEQPTVRPDRIHRRMVSIS